MEHNQNNTHDPTDPRQMWDALTDLHFFMLADDLRSKGISSDDQFAKAYCVGLKAELLRARDKVIALGRGGDSTAYTIARIERFFRAVKKEVERLHAHHLELAVKADQERPA